MLAYIIKKTRALSLVKRMILMVLLFIVVPSITISYVAFRESSRLIVEDSKEFAYQNVRGISDAVDKRLSHYKNICHSLYSDNELKELLEQHRDGIDSENCEQLINDRLFSINDKYILNAQIITPDIQFTQISRLGEKKGGILLDSSEIYNLSSYKKAFDPSNSLVWENPKMLQYKIMDQRFSSIYIDNFITIFQLIPDLKTGEALGVIMMNISKQLFSDENITFDTKIESVILADMAGIVIMLDGKYKIPEINPEDMKQLLASHDNSIIKKIDNEDYLITYKKIDITDWYIVNFMKYASAVAPVKTMSTALLNVGLFCIIFALFFGIVIVKGVRDPVKNLVDTMKQVGNDGILVKYNDESTDEIAFLGSQFNNMMDRVDNLIKTVYEMELIKANEELRRKRAEFDMLQMQINPHFIYNMLEIIRWKVLAKDDEPEKISDMIESFAGVMRSLTKFSESSITIGEEMQNITEYLNAINLLFEKQIKLIVNIDEHILNNCFTIRILFQPIIENIVMHAFKKVSHDCKITIRAELTEKLHISIEDNGKGMPPDEVGAVMDYVNGDYRKGKHVGLTNVNERIRLAYGQEYGISITSLLGKGTIVNIVIPGIREGFDDVQNTGN